MLFHACIPWYVKRETAIRPAQAVKGAGTIICGKDDRTNKSLIRTYECTPPPHSLKTASATDAYYRQKEKRPARPHDDGGSTSESAPPVVAVQYTRCSASQTAPLRILTRAEEGGASHGAHGRRSLVRSASSTHKQVRVVCPPPVDSMPTGVMSCPQGVKFVPTGG